MERHASYYFLFNINQVLLKQQIHTHALHRPIITFYVPQNSADADALPHMIHQIYPRLILNKNLQLYMTEAQLQMKELNKNDSCNGTQFFDESVICLPGLL